MDYVTFLAHLQSTTITTTKKKLQGGRGKEAAINIYQSLITNFGN
jgi:hypothetical protein